jgi:hypothetical protein
MCILYNQRDATYTMFFIIISALHISGGISAHHQELIKTVCAALGTVMLSCCLPLVWMGWNEHSNPSTPAVNTGKTARNMQSADNNNNKEHIISCISLVV